MVVYLLHAFGDAPALPLLLFIPSRLTPALLSLPGKTRTKDKYRVVYTDHQRLELEKEFHYSRYITIRRKAELAAALGLTERQVRKTMSRVEMGLGRGRAAAQAGSSGPTLLHRSPFSSKLWGSLPAPRGTLRVSSLAAPVPTSASPSLSFCR